ncbi:MAG: LLM class flavin-dependent oxidoreductase [Nitrososphaerota archaeon]
MPRPRVSFGISFPNFSLETSAKIASEAERLKMDSVWVNDDLVGVFQRETFDAILCMAEMAHATRRVRVGSAVIATYRRHPVTTAFSLITLDHLSRGRLIAGLGSCCPSDEWGFPGKSEEVAERFFEFISALKKLASGSATEFHGKYFTLHTPELPVKPRQKPHPPIWAAANLDRTIREVARVADGWLPICVPPRIYSEELQILRESASEAGRPSRDIVAGCMVFAVMGRKRESALAKAMPLLAQTALWFNSARTRKMGVGVFRSPSEVNPDVVRELSIVGSVEDAAQRIGEYLDAGVEHLVLQPLPVDEIRASLPRIADAIRQAA